MRLIDADKADINAIAYYYGDSCYGDDVQAWVDEQPTIDAVPVVRCKDCDHMEIRFNARFCKVWCMFNGFGDDGFCNYGYPKDGAVNGTD